ncbi:MAG TPA: hypothetical protein VKR32_13430 [Puia sp.]|nr:hypothetical protein [Puia sp.]
MKFSIIVACLCIFQKATCQIENPSKDSSQSLFFAGFGWNAQIPFSNIGQYFSGPKGQQQPYRILFPSLWARLVSNKFLFEFEINPFVSSLIPSDNFYQSSNILIYSGAFVESESKSLVKLFGVGASISYEYQVSWDWWIGGGLQAAAWQKGFVKIDSTNEIFPNPNAGIPTSVQTFRSSGALRDGDWTILTRFQMHLFAEAQYRKDRWSSGIRVGLPFTPGTSDPLKVEAFFRICVISGTGKSKR